MPRRLRPNLRQPEEQAMLAGMLSVLQALKLVDRVRATRDGMRLEARNGLTILVIASERSRVYAEVGWWEEQPHDVPVIEPGYHHGMEAAEARNPDQLSELLAELVTTKRGAAREAARQYGAYLTWLAEKR